MDIFYTADLKAKFTAKIPQFLIMAGLVLIFIAIVILVLTFYPVFKEETNYLVQGPAANQEITPINLEFGIVIPKIRANSKVITDVDPYNSKEYQWALTKGVAHAKETVYPGQEGNVFIFSHSSVNFYEAARYNSVFYLLSKLEKEDEIDLYYKGEKFTYTVTQKVIADPGDLSYLTQKTDKKIITLMTCWPPGTTWKRLLVIGEIVEN